MCIQTTCERCGMAIEVDGFGFVKGCDRRGNRCLDCQFEHPTPAQTDANDGKKFERWLDKVTLAEMMEDDEPVNWFNNDLSSVFDLDDYNADITATSVSDKKPLVGCFPDSVF